MDIKVTTVSISNKTTKVIYLMNKRGKNRAHKEKSNKFKLYKFSFGLFFALNIFFIFYFMNLFLVTHKSSKYCYIMPTTLTIIVSYSLVSISIIMVFILYYKICIKQMQPYSLIKNNKRFIVFLSVIFLVASIICYSSYYSIDTETLSYTKSTLFSNQKEFNSSDVKRIDISIENVISSPTGATPHDNYFIIYTVYTDHDKYILESKNFYDYSEMFNYLSCVDCYITTDTSDYDELCRFELNRPFLSQKEKEENINIINKIFALKTE